MEVFPLLFSQFIFIHFLLGHNLTCLKPEMLPKLVHGKIHFLDLLSVGLE